MSLRSSAKPFFLASTVRNPRLARLRRAVEVAASAHLGWEAPRREARCPPATTAARHEADETREEKGRASDATLRHAMVRAAAISEPVTWCDACAESISLTCCFSGLAAG